MRPSTASDEDVSDGGDGLPEIVVAAKVWFDAAEPAVVWSTPVGGPRQKRVCVLEEGQVSREWRVGECARVQLDLVVRQVTDQKHPTLHLAVDRCVAHV